MKPRLHIVATKIICLVGAHRTGITFGGHNAF